jgi:hypothetical protein
MKYADEMSPGAIILHTNFHKDWFNHSKVYEEREYTDSMEIA